jgi:riboflavin kinase/FMN adenylyltransferase
MEVAWFPSLDLPRGARPAVTLGNFDGVHLGHQQAMRLLQSRARALSSPSVAVTFEPHPISVVRPDDSPKRILTLEQKQEVLASLGIDWLVIIDFTPEFSRVTPEEFVKMVLVNGLHASELVLGGNFRFGRGRAGDLDSLRTMGERFGFVVHRVEASTYKGEMISSSRIRDALAAGEVGEARVMLGRHYFVDGKVIEGDGRGQGMGFPTANVKVTGDVLVSDGVYVTEARVGEKRFRGMTHVGSRPTFGLDARTVETHLFEFNDNVYGEPIRLYFYKRVRGTVFFETAEALAAQLHRDRDEALRYFEEKHQASDAESRTRTRSG